MKVDVPVTMPKTNSPDGTDDAGDDEANLADEEAFMADCIEAAKREDRDGGPTPGVEVVNSIYYTYPSSSN